MTLQQTKEQFFNSVEPWIEAYQNLSFSYVAARVGEDFVILQARIILSTRSHEFPYTHQVLKNIRIGQYHISEISTTPTNLLDSLLTGRIQTPHGDLVFLPGASGEFAAFFQPLHPEGLSQQSRISVLTITGASLPASLNWHGIDWELKAGISPYESLKEAMYEYRLGDLRQDATNIEVVAFSAIEVDLGSPVTGTTARLGIRLSDGLSHHKAGLGYKVSSQGKVIERKMVLGEYLKWSDGEYYIKGEFDISIPDAALIQCFASYDGVVHHQSWLLDAASTQNPRRSVFQAIDPELLALKELLTRPSGSRGNAREFETGVAWLLWLLGFSPAHLGDTAKSQEAADILVTTPAGHFAVVECTTGLLKADNKLPLLVSRTAEVVRRLALSNNRHLKVLPIIITSRSREDVRADLEQAERLGILVLTQENIQEAIFQTLLLPSADRRYAEAEQEVRDNVLKYEREVLLPGIIN